MFMLVDACFIFSKKVNLMADLHRKYIRRSDVELVEIHSFDVTFSYFSVLWWYRVT